jgi:hypothetical protein
MRKELLPIGALTALPLVLYAPFLFGRQVLYWGVYLLQFYPWRLLAVEQIASGEWPLWNPYLGAGTPLAANLQTAVFYPPNVLFLLMPVERAFGWELALHIALAGIAAYTLGRVLGLSRFASLIAGLTYGGGGFLVARWLFPSMVYAAAWLPLMMALTEKVAHCLPPSAQGSDLGDVTATGRRRQAGRRLLVMALLALTVALQLLAGHAQTSFYSAFVMGAFGIVRTLRYGRRARSGLGRRLRYAVGRLGSMAAAALWGTALAAIQLIPSAEFAVHSQRGGRLTDLTFAFELSFWPWRLLTLVMPDLFGNPARDEFWGYGTYWEDSAFLGVLALLLAIAAASTRWRKRRTHNDESLSAIPFFGILAIVSVVLALGDNTTLYPILFRHIPGFGLFQAPARLMVGYALAVPLLAAIGADTFRPTQRTQARLRLAVVAGLGIAIAGTLARLALPDVRHSLSESTIRLGISVALAAAVLAMRRRWPGKRHWQTLVVGAVAAELLVFGWGLAPGSDNSVYHTRVATAERLESQPEGRLFVTPGTARRTYDRYISLASFGSDDPEHLQGLRERLFPNLNTIHGLPAVGNYDPLIVESYRDLYELLEARGEGSTHQSDITSPVLDLFGARYLVSDETLDLPRLYDGGPGIYVNEGALPAAYLVHRARVVESASQRLEMLEDPTYNPLLEVLLSVAPVEPLSPPAQVPARESVKVVRQGPSRVKAEVELAAPGYLVLADTYYPGWRATVDGQETTILPANHAFRAVQLKEGKHTVLFEYAPASFGLGKWLSFCSTALLAAAFGTGWVLRRAA